MTNAELRYTGKGWNSLGPVLLTDTIRTLCHVGRGTNHSISGYHQNCYGLTVLKHSSFYPIKHIDRKILFETNADKFWMVLFSNAYSVHFYGSNTSGRYLIWKALFLFFYSVHCFLYVFMKFSFHVIPLIEIKLFEFVKGSKVIFHSSWFEVDRKLLFQMSAIGQL